MITVMKWCVTTRCGSYWTKHWCSTLDEVFDLVRDAHRQGTRVSVMRTERSVPFACIKRAGGAL